MIDAILRIGFSVLVFAVALKLLRHEEVNHRLILSILAIGLAIFLFDLILALAVLLLFFFLLKAWREGEFDGW